MTAHRIRIAINPSGILCSVCDQSIRWETTGHLDDPAFIGHWVHVEPDPVELAASMKRHPSGKGRQA